jgi:hypothetical protein
MGARIFINEKARLRYLHISMYFAVLPTVHRTAIYRHSQHYGFKGGGVNGRLNIKFISVLPLI